VMCANAGFHAELGKVVYGEPRSHLAHANTLPPHDGAAPNRGQRRGRVLADIEPITGDRGMVGVETWVVRLVFGALASFAGWQGRGRSTAGPAPLTDIDHH